MLEALRTTLELIYFACAPLIVLVGCLGLYQLKIAKDTARMNAKRDSLHLAASQCEYYQRHIIPLVNAMDNAVKEKEINFFKVAEAIVKDNNIIIRRKVELELFSSEYEKVRIINTELTAGYNALEAFSTFFISGVADEKVAFENVGYTFCETVKRYLPEIFPISELGFSYKSIIKLYLLWTARKERQQLIKNRTEIEDKLKNMSDEFIQPVGTK